MHRFRAVSTVLAGTFLRLGGILCFKNVRIVVRGRAISFSIFSVFGLKLWNPNFKVKLFCLE